MENSDTEGFHNIIANLFEVVLEFATIIPPHEIYQLEPNLLLEVNALVQSHLVIPVVVKPVSLIPSP